MEQIKLLLVDDQTLFVESLKTVLETRASDLKVVAVAYDGLQAIAMVNESKPDVILMDVRMPKKDGVECIRNLKGQYPELKILMLTTFDDDCYVVEALRLGAVGYLLKDMPPTELITAIRAVHEGGVLISPKVAAKIIDKLAKLENNQDQSVTVTLKMSNKEEVVAAVKDLSNREKEILQLMTLGLDNKEIAQKLFIAEQTVKNYVSIIYSKLGVRDRVQASRLVMRAGINEDI